MRYIALLRGINVGRHKRIKMADLINIFESLGFEGVKTYLQSGNVVFESENADESEIIGNIESEISEACGFHVDIVLRTGEEWESIFSSNPFIKDVNIEVDKLHVTFLSNMPDEKAVFNLDINKDESERFEVSNREIYLYCPNGYGRTKLKNDVFERKLKRAATTRNWKTVTKLLEMSKSEK
jgi:Uncharacterized protein conserved in bacteria